MAQVHSESSEFQLPFLSRSFGVSEMSPRPQQDWHWSLSLKPLGAESAGGMRTHFVGEGLLPGGLGQLRDPSQQLLPLPALETDPKVGGWLPTSPGQSAGRPHKPGFAHEGPAAAQRGSATCSRSPSSQAPADSQAAKVLSVLPDGWLLTASFQFPVLPPHLLFSAPICCSCPVPCCPPHVSLWASASLSHCPCLPSAPHPGLISSFSRVARTQEPGNSEVPGDQETPSHRSLSLCPVAAAGRVGKGQRARPQRPDLELGPGSRWERNEETRNWGTEGVGVSEGQRLPRGCKREPLPALRAELGLRLDFAQRSAGFRLRCEPRMIRSLNKTRTQGAQVGGQGVLPGPLPRGDARRAGPRPPVGSHPL